jgi:hypothetical protein
MTSRKMPRVLKYSNLPTKLPIGSTAIAWLLLDRFKAPGWVWGAVGVIWLAIWAAAICQIWVEDRVDIFAEGKDGKASWLTRF